MERTIYFYLTLEQLGTAVEHTTANPKVSMWVHVLECVEHFSVQPTLISTRHKLGKVKAADHHWPHYPFICQVTETGELYFI